MLFHGLHPYRIAYNYLMSDDPNFIEKYYYSKLNEMDVTREIALEKTINGNLNLEALNYLGINLSNLKNMSNEEIMKSQNKAYEYFEVDAESPKRDQDLKEAIDYYKIHGRKLTSGNGYVDILLLMSVIVTSLSVISIIIFSLIQGGFMEVITIHNKKYQVINNYKDAINVEELEEKITEYFDDFDYIVGDIA